MATPFVGMFVTFGAPDRSAVAKRVWGGGSAGATRMWKWVNVGASCEDAYCLCTAMDRWAAFTMGAEQRDVVSARRIGERTVGG